MWEDLSVRIEKVDDYRWRIPREGKMRTDGMVYLDERMLNQIRQEQSLLQVKNVAHLPGIVGNSLGMPDIHWGYGFPIGGVAAFDLKKGLFLPGVWDTISTVGSDCCAPVWSALKLGPGSRRLWMPCFEIFRPVSGPGEKI